VQVQAGCDLTTFAATALTESSPVVFPVEVGTKTLTFPSFTNDPYCPVTYALTGSGSDPATIGDLTTTSDLSEAVRSITIVLANTPANLVYHGTY